MESLMKNELRRTLKQKRTLAPKTDIQRKSTQIKHRLFTLPEFRNANTILFYVSYNNEVYTHDMIQETLNGDKHVVVPYSDTENKTVIPSSLQQWDDLKPGAYGILEPKKTCRTEVPLDTIDIMLVPGVGFDQAGRRIGHGMGYYDRLLTNTPNTIHIGLAFEFQIVTQIPVEKHDIPVDILISEQRIIHCKNFR